MAIRSIRPARTFNQQVVDGACEALGLLHAGLAWLFRGMGRCAARVIRPLPWPVRLAVPMAFLGGAFLLISYGGWPWYLQVLDLTKELHASVLELGILGVFDRFAFGGCVFGGVLIVGAAAAFIRHRAVLYLLRGLAMVSGAFWLVLLGFLWYFPELVSGTFAKSLGGVEIARQWRTEQWVMWIWVWVPFAGVASVLLVCTWLAKVSEYYTGAAADAPLIGDRIYNNLRSHGRDPRYRTSMYWPMGLYVVILFGPMIIRGCGWEKDYAIPKGSGTPNITIVKIKRIKRKKPEKLVLNMNSPIIWERPKLKDIKILQEVLEDTDVTYQASRKVGKLGAGGGTKGGWPHGMADARVRFIRLKYDGGKWDVNMGHGADYNLLLEFHKLTGFDIAPGTEYKEISRLARFRKGKAPPFVYMAGRGGIRISSREAKILRDYCLVEGGMIVADNAGGYFDRSFREMCRRVFPGKQLVDIPDDDPLYCEPFSFPNGSPPLWHHDNVYRPLGIRHEGRWAVFYHAGDMGDAWKTGHSGSSRAVSQRAYKLGINIMYYTFTRYLDRHHPK